MFDANVYGEEAKITISNQVDGIWKLKQYVIHA